MANGPESATEIDRNRPPDSDAVRANLDQTYVERVAIDPLHLVLTLPVADFFGLSRALEHLLLELNHPLRNWPLLLPELKGFLLQNSNRYLPHPRGPECFTLFFGFFLQALAESTRPQTRAEALVALTAALDRLAGLMDGNLATPYGAVWEDIFSRLAALPTEEQRLLAQSHFPLARIIRTLLEHTGDSAPIALAPMHSLLGVSCRTTYDHWLTQFDPGVFAEPAATAFERIRHDALRHDAQRLERLLAAPPSRANLFKLAALPSYLDIVRGYRQAVDQLGEPAGGEASPAAARFSESRKLRFMFHILEMESLDLIHEETLKKVNLSLVHLVELKQSFGRMEELFLSTFAFLKTNVVRYPHTALQCIEVLGTEVFRRESSILMEAFLDQVVRFGFQHARIQGVGADWQPRVNPAHLYNIRVWLNLIIQRPKWCSTLLSALILNIKLTGVLIRDTDLFQKEITALLNSEFAPVTNLVKQFCRLLPVYYNEIGAEGEIREVSTELDEIHRRADRLVHFLRKQCHVESTNLTVELARAALHFWRTGDKTPLAGVIAPPLWASLETGSDLFDRVHALTVRLFAALDLADETALLTVAPERIAATLAPWEDSDPGERRRLFLLCRLYHLLHAKYNLGAQGVREALAGVHDLNLTTREKLLDLLDQGVTGLPRLEALLDTLEELRAVIHSPERFEAREELYRKRHLTVDIPSVYGRYLERKFDALSLTFRLENLASVELEALVRRIPEEYISQAIFFRVAKYLKIFLRALALDGITSRKLTNLGKVLDRTLELNLFAFDQYRDIFQGFSQAVTDIVTTYFTSYHRDNLAIIVPEIPVEALTRRFAPLRTAELPASVERMSEALLRDLIGEAFGLQALDNFVARLQKALTRQEGRLAPEQLDRLMSYDPGKLFCPIHHPTDRTRNLIHLGAKGFNLVQMAEDGLPVPAGVIVTTEYFRCHDLVAQFPPARREFAAMLRHEVHGLERETGLHFGSTTRPLLLSVRSGALISMPGMMHTIHNVGLNEEIVAGLAHATGRPFFAWDNYRRFIQSWSMTHDVDRQVFTALMRAAKHSHGVRKKHELSPSAMANLARQYRCAAQGLGVEIPDNPWEQLTAAIHRVLASWESDKAGEYRRLMGVSHRWGTAVVLQRMVFGNVHEQAGSGVVFTAHPHRKLDRVVLWGDYTIGDQGEDIVGGLVSTRPISLEQCQYDRRPPASSLERCFPEIFQALLKVAEQLIYTQGWNPQEMEFTFDGPSTENLYMLQTRDMSSASRLNPLAGVFVERPELATALLGQGIGVSGGALCGRVVFSAAHIERFRREGEKVPLILVRYDTVPDDIREVVLVDGLLTARGGQTSHAAIVTARLGKTCVVGFEELTLWEGDERCTMGGVTIRPGEMIAIDGRRGRVYRGEQPVTHAIVGTSAADLAAMDEADDGD
ncbi:MAG: phosphoenolpyruvate synthase [Magnetococcales bacterium]|nr:phosphoenolpyruvate synthase [Magnetococcales bacterium]